MTCLNPRSQGTIRALLICCMFVLMTYSKVTNATVYPWVWLGKNDIQVTDHVKVEAEFRLHLIANAKHSLDIVTYDQRMDSAIGLPLILALEDAAKRGVQVRFATAWVSTLFNDPLRKADEYLRKIASDYPNFKYILFRDPLRMRNQDWGILDSIHLKIFIADNNIALVTGRGHAGEYLNWLDTAFFYKGAIVEQSRDTFNRMWEMLEREMGLSAARVKAAPSDAEISDELLIGRVLSDNAPGALSSRQASNGLMLSDTSPLQLSAEEQEELDVLKAWAIVPHSTDQDYQVRSIYFNFLEQMREQANRQGRTPNSFSYDERNQFLYDPFVEEVLRLLPQTHRFQMSIFALILQDRVIQALLKEKQRGMEMELITNGSEAHSIFPFAAGWFAGIHTLDDLLQAGVVGHELKPMGPDTRIYLHRKLLILDDHVFFGSHNLTKASSLTCDEYSIEVVSQEFADKMAQLSRHSIEVNTVPFNAAVVHEERLSTPIRQWFSSSFEMLYLRSGSSITPPHRKLATRRINKTNI